MPDRFDHLAAFREISKGDESAFSCLNTIFVWLHALDDLIDRDKVHLLSWIISAHLQFIETIANNQFFQKHKATLLPVLNASALAYLASEKFRENPSPLYRIGSQVLKSQYQDLFFTAASLIGGLGHAVAMQEKYRDFDFDPVPKP